MLKNISRCICQLIWLRSSCGLAFWYFANCSYYYYDENHKDVEPPKPEADDDDFDLGPDDFEEKVRWDKARKKALHLIEKALDEKEEERKRRRK